MSARIHAVVAIGKNRELGYQDKLLWHIPDDLKRFKVLTKGHPIIMGRKTFESIIKYLGKPLPERTNIVITRHPEMIEIRTQSLVVVGGLQEALEQAKALDEKEVHIGGGAQIYEQALPYIDVLHLTLIDETAKVDSYFPPYEHVFTKKVFEEKREWNGIKYRWVDLERG